MKKRLIYLCLLLSAMAAFVACSDKDNPMIAPEEINKNFGTAGTTLTMTYSGAPLVGKKVDFHTDDSRTATLTLKDVIPGEEQTTISNIELAEGEGQYTFSGTTVTTRATGPTGATISYSGAVSSKELKLSLTVTMPQSAWARTYKLADLTKGDEQYWVYSRKGLRPPYKYVYEEKTRKNTVVVSAGYVAIAHFLPGPGTTAQDTINAVGITTFKDLFRGVLGCIVPQVLRTVTLESDGNISAAYSSDPMIVDLAYILKAEDITPEIITTLTAGRTWLTSPKNLAYWFEKEGQLYVKLNVAAIVSQAMSESGTSGGEAIAGIISSVLNGDPATIKAMLTTMPVLKDMEIVKALANMKDATFALLLNWIKNGIPVKAAAENGHTHLYLDRESLDPIMAEVPALLPVLQSMVPEDAWNLTAGTITNLLNGYNYTTKFEIGLDLIAQ